MCALKQPTNQKRLTNVSIVRMKKCGRRFELACYPNKVKAWRDKVEKDLGQVLQSECVFSNVSKGEVAKKEELRKAFGTDSVSEIVLQILSKGELSLTEKERSAQQQTMLKDIAKLISDRCINPLTSRAYTPTMVEQALKDLHFVVKLNKSSKQQALDGIRLLKESKEFPIERANMLARICVRRQELKEKTLALCQTVLSDCQTGDGKDERWEIQASIQPENLHILQELLRAANSPDDKSPAGTVEVLEFRVDIEEEMKQKLTLRQQQQQQQQQTDSASSQNGATGADKAAQ